MMEIESSDNDEIVLSSRLVGSLPELKSIVSLVTCAICYGSLKEPLTTATEGCGHTFCSICVRGYLAKFKQQCPQCLKELHDRDLLINRPLKAIAQYIQTLIPKLEALFQGSQTKISVNETKQNEIFQSVSSKKDDAKLHHTSFRLKPEPHQNDSAKNFCSDAKNVVEASIVPSSSSVSCPVCFNSILRKNINTHLDGCLGGERTQISMPCRINDDVYHSKSRPNVPETPSINQDPSLIDKSVQRICPGTSKPSRINKVVYYLIKDPDLRKLLKKEGLDVQGDRKTLINRHQRFTVLWNSQCDSENPLTKGQIVNQLKREEQSLSNAASSSSPTTASLLNYDRNSRPEVIASKQKSYMQKNQSQFAQLIHQLKERKNAESNQSKEDSSGKKHSTDSIETTSEGIIESDISREHSRNKPSSAECLNDNNENKVEVYKCKNELNTISEPNAGEQSTIYEDICPLNGNLQPKIKSKTNEVPNYETCILPPLNSSTPKTKRLLTQVSNLDNQAFTNNDNSENLNPQIIVPENIKLENLEEEPSSKRQKTNRLSLSKRYGAGSTKKTPCPVCQELVRESLINFHLDHCLGNQESSEHGAISCNKRTTRSNSKDKEDCLKKKEKIVSDVDIGEKEVQGDKCHLSKINESLSADLFKDDSEDEFNFPLSQMHKGSEVTKKDSQSSAVTNSDTFKLLNVTPEIIEDSESNTQMLNFSELIEYNMKNPCPSSQVSVTTSCPQEGSSEQQKEILPCEKISENNSSEEFNIESIVPQSKPKKHGIEMKHQAKCKSNARKGTSASTEAIEVSDNTRDYPKRTTRASRAAKSASMR